MKQDIKKSRREFLQDTVVWVAMLAQASPLALRRAAAHSRPENLGKRLQEAKYQALLKELETKHGFSRSSLDRLFGKALLHPEIPRLFAQPFEAHPYSEYRKKLITPRMINEGKEFLKRNRKIFEKAEETYGVDPPVITAIIGIESKYGSRSSGGFKVFDALNTIYADIPRRRNFARKELIEFLLLCREENLKPNQVEGSYAGAMGMPQFIPSSYRRYAVDSDGDGRRDLWNSKNDVINSVAHYLSDHGWKKGAMIARRISDLPDDPGIRNLVSKGLKGKTTIEKLTQRGVTLTSGGPTLLPEEEVSLVSYEGKSVAVVFSNFRTILKYNRAVNYAMAISDLADAIKDKKT